MALAAIGLLGVAFTSAWFHYDFTTGRQTPPGGPQPEEVTGIERDGLDFYATQWQGDIEPSDPEMAQDALTVVRYGLGGAAGALALVVLAEIPGIASILRRRVSLALIGLALAGLATVAVATWLWLPGSMAGYGVDSPYTAFLSEPNGYTHTSLDWGWYATALAGCAVFATGLFKFQAGPVDPDIIEVHADNQ